MSEWYYARDGQQFGPVTFEKLIEITRSGGLDPIKGLVWTSSMKDWTPAGQVPGLFDASPTPAGAPQSTWPEPTPAASAAPWVEIAPGSEPIDVMACVKRGFELMKREFGTIFMMGLVYFSMLLVTGVIQGILSAVFSHGPGPSGTEPPDATGLGVLVVSQVLMQVFSIFMGLGLTRIGLNLVSGTPVTINQLFGEGSKLLRTIGASILFSLMVGVGCLFLIVPGVYLALRYGQYMLAIVDRDLGVMDAFSYSSELTRNNRLNLFVLGMLTIAIAVVSLIPCGIGLIFAGPVIWLSYLVAYRWMQYGHRATLDRPPGTP